MSELKGAKMEGSKVPAEEIKNPDLVAAIEKMQDEMRRPMMLIVSANKKVDR